MKKKILIVILFAIIVFLVLLFFVQKKKSAPLPGEKSANALEEIEARPKAGYTYTLSTGETITIYLPEGIDPPPQNVVEKMYREKKT
ncbi:hypothetical protein A3D03_02575 [Candidatus Gottesmanbacteria bacterium RIFCSPHIGHO2_02_FULL_40_13]|uniref:Uncharacterized protein n=1 Tax=Candidatus Gottesmanbacteria bacterium RIFCSPHIGHO2_02_FULL_40_13 TaxID=1798384 RepID=A0A1F6A9W1_9BACT|nr:MAG: hypothetical protein A3D03_02575 [Candidatus Gottesmanbacteria bacterium RIFCSPHIGHO2_02_FULL_40_13]